MLSTSDDYGVLKTEITEKVRQFPQNEVSFAMYFFILFAYKHCSLIKLLPKITCSQVNELKEKDPEPKSDSYMESKTFFKNSG